MVDFTALFLKMIFAMLVVLGLILILVRYVLPRFTSSKIKNRSREIQILERVALDPKKALFLVQVREEKLLLGASEQSVTLLKQWRSGDEEEN